MMTWMRPQVEIVSTGSMEIAVRDDAEALARIIALPPGERLAALASMNGIREGDAAGFAFIKQIHEKGDGFRLHLDDPRYAAGLARLVAADAWGQLRRDFMIG